LTIIDDFKIVRQEARKLKKLNPVLDFDNLYSAGCEGLLGALDTQKKINCGKYKRIKIHGAMIDDLRVATSWFKVRDKNKILPVYGFDDLSTHERECLVSNIPDLEMEVEKIRINRKLNFVLRQLPPRLEALIVFRYQKELLFCDIAKLFAISAERVYQLHKKALFLLRKGLVENGYDSNSF